MLLGCPWLKDVKVFHDWGNNITIIERANIIWTIPIIKKLGAPTKCPKVLVCYDFHYGIYDKEEDLMFVIEPWLFSIATIIILILVFSNQLVKLITLTSLNLVEHVNKHVEPVSKPHVLSNVPIKLMHVRHDKIAIIPPDIFQQRLP
jgi:hypothetical protein